MSETTVSLSESEELSSGAEPSWMGSTGVWEIGMAVRGRDGGGARESAAGWVREAEAYNHAAARTRLCPQLLRRIPRPCAGCSRDGNEREG